MKFATVDEGMRYLMAVLDTPKVFYANLNPCDGCTVCCTAPGIDDGMLKPTNQTCEHCTASGCGIYKDRPEVCRDYACLYSIGFVNERPDSNGIAWTFQNHRCPGGKLLLMGHALDARAATKDPVAKATMRRLMEHPDITGIAIRDDKEAISYIVLPNGEIDGQTMPIAQSDPLKLQLSGEEHPYQIKYTDQ